MRWSEITAKIALFLFIFPGGYGLADYPLADGNGDCIVNLKGLAVLSSQWFTGVPVISNDYLYTGYGFTDPKNYGVFLY